MSHQYMDAYHKDVDRLLKEAAAIKAKLDKNPMDKTALAAKKKLAPFLTKEALLKRREFAQKKDSEDTGKMVKQCGLPGW
jgi:hypothetical protein